MGVLRPLAPVRYLALGLALMGLKYAGDVALVYAATGRVWVPWEYVRALVFLQSPLLDPAPTWLLWAMFAWLLPFLYTGIELTMRRAVDAGWTPWLALGVLVPYVNYAIMIALCAVPSTAPPAPDTPVAERRVLRGRVQTTSLAAGAGAGFGLLMIGLSVYALRSYGVALIVGTPYIVATLAAFIQLRLDPDSGRFDALIAGQLAIVTIAVAAILVAMEGAICVGMALPLACIAGAFGVGTGWTIARSRESRVGPIGLGLLALPLAAVLEPAPGSHVVAREVLTVVDIAAAPDAVWPHVVAFRPLDEPTDWLSRAGVAYPKSARIAGTGVGAVRYCEFSTGAFVEPITAWEPGRRLAFDVTESPPPLRELSPYSNVQAPHLDGFLRSRRGEFRLIALPGGRTRLEGRTWYELDIAPEGYWRLIADWMIHRIHERVLRHIKAEVE
jgi:hypothetical protein